MQPHELYARHKRPSLSRVDSIIALYRHAIDRLRRAAELLAEQRFDGATPLLSETAVIVSSLSGNLAGTTDPSEINFLRLYEFVAHQLTLKTPADLHAARKVLVTLLEGFEAIRNQAADLEAQGILPPIGKEIHVHLRA